MTNNKELLQKAKDAKSVQELMALAKENNVEMTEESAQEYSKLLKEHELSDNELENVSGGSCAKTSGPVTTETCKICGQRMEFIVKTPNGCKDDKYSVLGCIYCRYYIESRNDQEPPQGTYVYY